MVTVVVAAVSATGIAGYQALAASTSSATPPIAAESRDGQPPPAPRPDRDRRRMDADGSLPDGVTIFDGEYSGVAKLDPDLLSALRQAATDASGDGVTFYVNSGWRSRAHQSRLLRDAVDEYGSEQEAARWVATPQTSPHVSGDAIDVGPDDATAWLSEHGAAYGLCQIYDNEPWHYELRAGAAVDGCSATYADPSDDPRMQP